VLADRPGGILPGEGRLDPGGQADLHALRSAHGMSGVRARARRAFRYLGWAVRARAAQAQAAGGLIQLFRVHAQQVGDLLDDHVVDQVREILAVEGPELQGPAVQDDPGRYVVPPRPARQQPGQRHLAVFEHVGVVHVEVRGDLLDGELHAGQLLGVPAFQRLDRVEYQVVEQLRLGPRRRYV